VRRRELVLGAGAALLGTIARAQTPRRYRLGILWWGRREDMWGGDLDRILDELGLLGYVRGARLEVHERIARTQEEFRQFARELVAIPVDVILTESTPGTRSAREATNAIPIVTTVGDPIEVGFARTLQKPGGNITGIAQNRLGLITKALEVLRLLRPGIAEMAYLGSGDPVPALAEAAAVAGIRLRAWDPRGQGFEKGLDELKARRIDTLFCPWIVKPEDAAIALRHRVALVVQDIKLVKDGGALMSATNDNSRNYVRVARIIDRIFRGDKPADIPFDLAERFIMTVNAKTAAALGIRLPPEVRLRVDHVFE
jgi:putative tryptophan/tyrosine transport system substrate-binding protein